MVVRTIKMSSCGVGGNNGWDRNGGVCDYGGGRDGGGVRDKCCWDLECIVVIEIESKFV
jgi:hypothetical protein